MSERDARPAAGHTGEGQQEHLAEELSEGASPGTVGALDGPATVGSLGAVSPAADSEIPDQAPDPSIGRTEHRP